MHRDLEQSLAGAVDDDPARLQDERRDNDRAVVLGEPLVAADAAGLVEAAALDDAPLDVERFAVLDGSGGGRLATLSVQPVADLPHRLLDRVATEVALQLFLGEPRDLVDLGLRRLRDAREPDDRLERFG